MAAKGGTERKAVDRGRRQLTEPTGAPGERHRRLAPDNTAPTAVSGAAECDARLSVASPSMRSPSTGDGVEDPNSALFQRVMSESHPASDWPVEGLRMDGTFTHEPVLLDEVIELFGPVPSGWVVDATVGGAGHATGILRAHPHLCVLGIDRDADAREAASAALAPFHGRARVAAARFDDMREVVETENVGPIVGALFDLGVSSPQLDRAGRGFSYRNEGPLDMRMDRSQTRTAADVVNEYDEEDLTKLFHENGERFAGRVARAIVAARPLRTTSDLAEVVRNAIPAATRRHGGHPARNVFQALRIEVNGELDALNRALDAALDVIVPGGRIVTIAYHSGEDRMIKQRLLADSGVCDCPPGLPCRGDHPQRLRLLTRGSRKSSEAEVLRNHRAESARLRAAEILDSNSGGNNERTSA